MCVRYTSRMTRIDKQKAKQILAARTKEKSFAGILKWSKMQITTACRNADSIKKNATRDIKKSPTVSL